MNLFQIVTALSSGEVDTTNWIEMIKKMIEDADPMRFVSSLPYMGVGMLGIFLVMGILIIGTAVLNKVTNLKPKKKD